MILSAMNVEKLDIFLEDVLKLQENLGKMREEEEEEEPEGEDEEEEEVEEEELVFHLMKVIKLSMFKKIMSEYMKSFNS